MEMKRFSSPYTSDLADSLDGKAHGEQPVVTVEETEDWIEVAYILPGFNIWDDDQEVDRKLMRFKKVGIPRARSYHRALRQS